MLFDRVTRDQLVHSRLLAFARAEQATDSLNVFALAERGADDDRDVCVGHVDALVENPRRNQRAKVSCSESDERLVSFLTADLAGDRHDQMFASHRIGRLIVRGEDQCATGCVSREKTGHELALASGVRD